MQTGNPSITDGGSGNQTVASYQRITSQMSDTYALDRGGIIEFQPNVAGSTYILIGTSGGGIHKLNPGTMAEVGQVSGLGSGLSLAALDMGNNTPKQIVAGSFLESQNQKNLFILDQNLAVINGINAPFITGVGAFRIHNQSFIVTGSLDGTLSIYDTNLNLVYRSNNGEMDLGSNNSIYTRIESDDAALVGYSHSAGISLLRVRVPEAAQTPTQIPLPSGGRQEEGIGYSSITLINRSSLRITIKTEAEAGSTEASLPELCYLRLLSASSASGRDAVIRGTLNVSGQNPKKQIVFSGLELPVTRQRNSVSRFMQARLSCLGSSAKSNFALQSGWHRIKLRNSKAFLELYSKMRELN